MRILATAAALLGLGGVVVGCLVNVEFDCPDYDGPNVDENGKPNPCHDGPTCEGECVTKPESAWSGPALFWIGPTSETPPECPKDRAPVPSMFGHADLVVVNTCPTCTCGPPSGACELPKSINARAAICQAPGGWVTPFDGPAGWDGSCTSANAIPQGKDCGGAPCVQSVTIGPLSVVENGCTAYSGPQPLPLVSAYWQTQAYSCEGVAPKGFCNDPGLICVPSSAPPPPGFQQCVYRFGEQSCPQGYSGRHVVYESFGGQLVCAPCKCGPVEGSTCNAGVSFFSDNACSVPLPLTVGIDSNQAVFCADVPAGVGLGSKLLSNLTYKPGACQASGGEPMGGVEPVTPWTICCEAAD